MNILLSPNARGWTYDFNALALARELRGVSIAYGPLEAERAADDADVIVDFWWRGPLDQRYGKRVVRQISSHRWQRHKYGKLPATVVAARHCAQAGAVIVPSARLHSIMSQALEAIGSRVPVFLTPKGFAPELFSPPASRSGPLTVGWCGNARSADKRLKLLCAACPDLRVVGPRSERGAIPYEQMPDFYRELDVITCASDAEGDPRTLIEGMACGCFPVTTDVGIAGELIEHGVNGLLVEQSADAFHAAFLWCRENLSKVREAGKRNAEQMLCTRTWAMCAPKWAAAFDAVYTRRWDTR